MTLLFAKFEDVVLIDDLVTPFTFRKRNITDTMSPLRFRISVEHSELFINCMVTTRKRRIASFKFLKELSNALSSLYFSLKRTKRLT